MEDLFRNHPLPWTPDDSGDGYVWDANREIVGSGGGVATVGGNDARIGNLWAASPEMLVVLRSAESFISGFEGDEMQEGVDEMLAGIRGAIAKAEGRDTVTITKPQAMGKSEAMLDLLHRNLDAWEDEEESAQEEHEELITDLREFLGRE